MAENKTQKTTASAAGYINSVSDAQIRADCKAVAIMIRAATGKNAKMWGTSLIGYGTYDYRYASGREGSFFVAGFSPRTHNISIYIMSGFGEHASLMKKLGRYKTGKSCLYIKKLDDVNLRVLQSLIERSVKYMQKTYKCY